ncbi:MAG: hypothetical protein ACSLEL_05160 [Candidatus Malihini olakiniferum]
MLEKKSDKITVSKQGKLFLLDAFDVEVGSLDICQGQAVVLSALGY